MVPNLFELLALGFNASRFQGFEISFLWLLLDVDPRFKVLNNEFRFLEDINLVVKILKNLKMILMTGRRPSFPIIVIATKYNFRT